MALGMIGNDYRNMPHSYDYGMPQNHSLAEEDSRKLHYNADGELVRDDQASYNGEKKVDGTKDSRDDSEDGRNKIGKSREECQTCKNRKYVDGSNDANVSFKNAAHVSPEAAASACIQCIQSGTGRGWKSDSGVGAHSYIHLSGMRAFVCIRRCDGHTD